MFEVGQKVRFVGRGTENDRYHNDYKQLLGQVGTVRVHPWGTPRVAQLANEHT